MANTVIALKKSGTVSAAPSALANGELAINYADGKLFYKNVTGSIVAITSGAPSSNSFATINANGSLITAVSNNSTLTLIAGSGIGMTSDIINDIITITANIKPAFDQANSKTYTFEQNTAPSTANAADLWVNTDTGVIYQNFGNTTNPVWAEFGPTGTLSNTAPGIVATPNLNFTDGTYQTTSATVIGTAGNNYTITVGASSNAWANTVGIAGNNYATVMDTAGNNYTVSVGASANNWANTKLANSTGTFAGALTVTGNTTVNGIAPNYAPNRPGFRVYGSGTTNNLTTTQNGTGCLTSNNWSVSYNQGGYLANTNGIFTAPVTGLYQVNVIGRNSGYASGISQIGVTKNGTSGGTVGGECILMVEWAASSSMNHAGGSTIINLNAGDTLACKILAGQINFDGNDNWSVAYIG